MICRLGYSVVYACRCSAPLSSCNLFFLNMFLDQKHGLLISLNLIPLMLWYLETCNDYNLCYWGHWSRTRNIRYGNYVRWLVWHLGIFNKGDTYCSDMQHPGLKLKVDTSSIFSSIQEAVTLKPCYRGPPFRYHCHFVLWWRLQCVFHSSGIISCSRWSIESERNK